MTVQLVCGDLLSTPRGRAVLRQDPVDDHQDRDDDRSPDREAWREAVGAKGWGTPTWPKEYGGGGLSKAEARIDWQLPAAEIARRIRAFDPFPGAVTESGGVAIKVWRASETAGHGTPGSVLQADGQQLVVACGEGALALTLLQKPGSKRLQARDFLQGFALAAGDQLV